MKLTNIALQTIIASKEIKHKLGLALDRSEGSINLYLRENKDDLTKAAALKVIREETGLTDEEILEE